jgi:hypothetical protein
MPNFHEVNPKNTAPIIDDFEHKCLKNTLHNTFLLIVYNSEILQFLSEIQLKSKNYII